MTHLLERSFFVIAFGQLAGCRDVLGSYSEKFKLGYLFNTLATDMVCPVRQWGPPSLEVMCDTPSLQAALRPQNPRHKAGRNSLIAWPLLSVLPVVAIGELLGDSTKSSPAVVLL